MTTDLALDHPRKIGQKINFSARTIAAIRCPAGQRDIHVYDERTPGLAFRVTASGSRGFYFVRRVQGRAKRLRIGGSELTVEMARKIAAKWNGEVAQGMDPVEQRRQDRADSATLGDLVDHFIESHSKLHKRSWRDDEAMVKRYLSDWKPRRLSAITQEEIRSLHAKIGAEHGRYAANRLLSLLHAAYARPGDLWQGVNPVHGIAKFREKSRDRFLTADELPRFFKALADEENETIRDYVLVLLLVGARKSNAAAMRWEEIDFDRMTWRIPETKNGKPLILPFSREAEQILRRRQETSTSRWVFPSVSDTWTSASGHIVEFRTAWKAILDRAGITDLRMHDLRRTLGSWMAMSGSSLPTVGRALGHLSTATTAVYARLTADSVRSGVDAATAAMRALPAPKTKGK